MTACDDTTGEALAAAQRLRAAKARTEVARAARALQLARKAAEAGTTLEEYRRQLMREMGLRSAQARRRRRSERLREAAERAAYNARNAVEADCE